jgi:hypothetical protein
VPSSCLALPVSGQSVVEDVTGVVPVDVAGAIAGVRTGCGALAEYLDRVAGHRSRQGLRYELGTKDPRFSETGTHLPIILYGPAWLPPPSSFAIAQGAEHSSPIAALGSPYRSRNGTLPQQNRRSNTVVDLTLQHPNHTVLIEGPEISTARLVLVVWWPVVLDEPSVDAGGGRGRSSAIG